MSDETYVFGAARQREVAIRSAASVACSRQGSRGVQWRSVLRASSSRSGQFQHVMSTADQTPLTGDLRHAPQQELPEATRLFDLATQGFDHLFSKPIATAMPGSSQADLHRVDSRPRDGLARSGGRGLAVLLPTRGDVSSNGAAIQRLEIVLGAIPRIRR